MPKWKRDALYGVVLLVICVVNFVLAFGMDDGNMQYPLASPNSYMQLWLVVLEILSAILVTRSIKSRSNAETKKIWDRLAILTVTVNILYIILVKNLGFFICTFILVAVLTIAYGNRALGIKKGRAGWIQNGKFALFALITTIATQWVFSSFLAVRLPSFSLF